VQGIAAKGIIVVAGVYVSFALEWFVEDEISFPPQKNVRIKTSRRKKKNEKSEIGGCGPL